LLPQLHFGHAHGAPLLFFTRPLVGLAVLLLLPLLECNKNCTNYKSSNTHQFEVALTSMFVFDANGLALAMLCSCVWLTSSLQTLAMMMAWADITPKK